MRSEIALPKFLDERTTFDFGFVDGTHHFDGAFVDLYYLGRLVRPAGSFPAAARATAFYLNKLGWKLEEVLPSDDYHQWAALRLPRDA